MAGWHECGIAHSNVRGAAWPRPGAEVAVSTRWKWDVAADRAFQLWEPGQPARRDLSHRLPVPCLPFPAGSGGLWPRSPRCASGSVSGARGIPGPTPRSLVAHSHVSVVERGLGLSLGLLWALLIHEDRAPTECIKCALSSGDNRSRRIPCSGRDSKASPCGNLGTVFLRRSHKGLGTPALRAQLWTRPPPPVSEVLCPSGPPLALHRFRARLRRGGRGQ